MRAELARTNVGRGPKVDLMPTERRLANLAAHGLGDQDIADATHTSFTTVENDRRSPTVSLIAKAARRMRPDMNHVDSQGTSWI